MKEAVLVYDDKTKEGLLKEAEKIAAKAGYGIRKLSAARLSRKSLEDAFLVLYCMEGRYREGTERDLSGYVQNGGTLVVLGGNPFSEPIGDIPFSDMQKGIRAFGFCDTFQEAPCEGECFMRVLRENWNPFEKKEEPALAVYPERAYAGLYHLSHKTEGGNMERHGDLLPLAGFFDKEGQMISAPVVRISYKKGGQIYLFAWEEREVSSGRILSGRDSAKGVLSCFPAAVLLEEICQSALSGFLSFEAEMTYARYFPGEEICLELYDRKISGRGQAEYLIEVSENDRIVYTHRMTAGSRRQSLILPVTKEGEYEVRVRGLLKGVCQMRKKTGFYLMSEEKSLRK